MSRAERKGGMSAAYLARIRNTVRLLRRRQFIEEALRASKFTAEERLEMSLALISFALDLKEAARNAENG